MNSCESSLKVFVFGFMFQVTELECVSGQTTVIKSQKTELNQTIEELELALKAKEEVGSGRASTDLLINSLVHKMSENGEKCRSQPKMTSLNVFFFVHNNSVYCHRRLKKPENIHI